MTLNGFEVWEVKEGIREEIIPPKFEDEDYWVPLKRTPNLGFKSRGKTGIKEKWFTRVEVQFIVGIDGNLQADLRKLEKGDGSVKCPSAFKLLRIVYWLYDTMLGFSILIHYGRKKGDVQLLSA